MRFSLHLIVWVGVISVAASQSRRPPRRVPRPTTASTLALKSTPAPKPSCDRDPTDKCAQRLSLVGDPNFVYPRNDSAMLKLCRQVESDQACINDYADACLKPYTKQITKLLVYGVGNTNKKYCSYAKKRQMLIRMAPCAEKLKRKHRRCWLQYIDDLQGISAKAAIKLKIPMACCKYYEAKECFLEPIREERICRHQDEIEMELILDGYAYEVLSLLCQDYTEDSDKCAQLAPRIPKKDKNVPRPLSVLPPFVEILNSFPEADAY